MTITEQARARYQLHRQSRHRLLADLGSPSIPGATHFGSASHLNPSHLNQKLTAWWELDFAAFRAEVKKGFKRDLPLAERDEWEAWLQQRRSQHQAYTAEIIRLETELNQRIYALFNLTPAEIKIVEDSTKYRYGEV
jgi:hypothetical protein